jgi:hypothetical protein
LRRAEQVWPEWEYFKKNDYKGFIMKDSKNKKQKYIKPVLTKYGPLESITRSSPLTENTENIADCLLANCFPDPPPPIKG